MKRSFRYLLLYGAVLTGLLFTVLPVAKVAAAVAPPPPTVTTACQLPDGRQGVLQTDGRTCCPGGATTVEQCVFGKYITPVIELLSAAVGLLVVISVVYGAFEIVTAGSEVAKAAAGRKRIIQTLIGLFAYMSLFALLQFLVPGGLV
jgi:hypothetical protein